MLRWLDPLHGPAYQFWSGIGGGSPVFLLAVGWWRHHNCRQPRCLRLGHPHSDHGQQPVCRKHVRSR